MIFTFYSFKGGVGRSMALASVAFLLAQRGLKVLAIDFDLEAPGLERYYFETTAARRVRAQPGLIDLLLAYKLALTNEAEFRKGEFRNWRRFVQSAAPTLAGGGRVDILTAGRREPASQYGVYAAAVRSFDWQDFFDNWKGERFFDWLRSELIGEPGADGAYDVVLVDSRTGITEMGGVCAYQLADVAVMLCAANDQNLEGTLSVARDFRSDSTLALRRGRPLEILVIPARLEESNPRRAEFLVRFERTFERSAYLPKQLYELKLDYATLALPYEPEFAIIEQIVGEQASAAGSAVAAAARTLERLTNALIMLAWRPGRLRDLQPKARRAILGMVEDEPESLPQVANPLQAVADFDLFLDSALAQGDEFDRRLVSELRGMGLRVAATAGELTPGSDFALGLEPLLDVSRAVAVVFRGAEVSPWTSALIDAARKRQLPILPLLVTDSPNSSARQALSAASLGHVRAVELGTWDRRNWAQRVYEAFKELESASDRAEAPVSDREPYPGARPLLEGDAEFFFGRAAELDRLRALVGSDGITVLTGPAGVGKTSLVRAGLLPALRHASAGSDSDPIHALYLDLAVDPDPEALLAGWLRDAGGATALVVFDSIDSFPACGTAPAIDARIRQVEGLLSSLPHAVRALVVMRDTLDEAVRREAFGRWQLDLEGPRAARLELPAMSLEALAAAIEKPAARLGHVVEPGLAPLLISQAGTSPSAVAQIARALPILWQQRRRGWVTGAALEATQGLTGHFSRAWKTFAATLTEAERAAANALVQTLSQLDSAMRWTAGSVAWPRVATVPAVGAVVDAVSLRDRLAGGYFIDLWRTAPVEASTDADERVLQGGEARVSLPFDAPSLFGEAHAQPFDPPFLLWRRQFGSFVAAWEQSGREPAALLSGPALAEGLAQASRHADLMSEPERMLIEQSRHRQAEVEAGQQELELERRAGEELRRSRDLAEQARVEAEQARQMAEHRREEADVARQRAEAEAFNARRQKRRTVVAAAVAVALLAIALGFGVLATLRSGTIEAGRDTAAAYLAMEYAGANPTAAAITLRDVLQAARAAPSARALRFSLLDRSLTKAVLKGHTGRVLHAAFSPDGQTLVTASLDMTARLWSRDGKPLAELKGHTDAVVHAAFSPDGQTLVTASWDKTARLWSRDGKPLAELKGHTDAVVHAAFSPDGQTLVTASEDNTARLWSRDGKPLAELKGHTDAVGHAAFSPDGQTLVTASRDKTARLWSRDGKPLAELKGHTDAVWHAAFSPDGQTLVTASRDKTARLWSRDGKPLAELKGHTDAVWHAAFSPDGQTLVTASWDKTARLWPISERTFIDRIGNIAKPCHSEEERRRAYPDETPEESVQAVARCEATATQRASK